MKVLICGEYGVFCKELINRMKKEKHTVFVITGSQKPSYEAPRDGVFQEYNFSYRSRSISKIIKNIQPDFMIILGTCDIKFTWEKTNEESVRFITGMTNLFMAAKENNVPQVIYCSSLGIYNGTIVEDTETSEDEKALNKILHSYYQVDNICKKQNGKDNKWISIIRFPQVYGDYRVFDHDVCGKMMEGLWTKTELSIASSTKHEVMYVKDAADVVMRVFSNSDRKYSYDVVGKKYTEKEIVTILKSIISGLTAEIKEDATRRKEPHEQYLSKRTEDEFYQKYDLKSGLSEFYKSYGKVRKKVDNSNERFAVLKDKIVPFIENILVFAVATMINYAIRDTWLGTNLNAYLFYLIVVSVIYGIPHALLGSVLIFCQRFFDLILTQQSINYTTYIDIIQILIVGVIVGYMRDKYKRNNRDLEDEKQYFQSELVDMTKIYDGNRYIKETYEKRLMTYENSMVRIYDVVKRLDYWEPQKVVFEAIDVIKELMEIDDIAIYITGRYGKYLRLLASSSEEARKMGMSVCIDENFFMYNEINEKRVYRNKNIGQSLPTYANGVYTGEKLTAVIMLWTKDLAKINLYEANMFALLCHLIEAAMSRARTFWNELSDQYIEDSVILHEEAYDKMYELCMQGKKQNKVIYSHLYISQEQISKNEKEICAKVQKMVRETDYIGRKSDGIHIILMNANDKDTEFVLRRFEEAQIEIEKLAE